MHRYMYLKGIESSIKLIITSKSYDIITYAGLGNEAIDIVTM